MHTVENCSLCLETSCTADVLDIWKDSFEVAPHTPFVNDTIIIMSPNFAEFLLDTTNNGNEILSVLEDIVEVVETGGTDL